MPFRFASKKVGLTYSCPQDSEDNPIQGCQQLLDWLVETFGDLKYIIGREDHKDGKKHYHAYCHFDERVDSKNSRVFDFKDVHPNIIKSPKAGWQAYCTKEKDFISNFWKRDTFKEAASCSEWPEAEDKLWTEQPRFMFQHATSAERHFKKRKQVPIVPRLFYGPWRNVEWDAEAKSLELIGPPGVGKTQWARYHCSHHGGYFYCKGTLNSLKYYKGEPWIIFDDVVHGLLDCNALLDVENGGTIPARYNDYILPPGVKRIFIHNGDVVWTGHGGAIARRKYTFSIE